MPRGFTDLNQRVAPYVDPHTHPVGVHDHLGVASPTNLLWDDLRVSLNGTSPGAATPNLTSYRDGLYLYAFSETVAQHLVFDVQLPHGWVDGSTIHPHIHWAPGNYTGTGVVRWELEYSWANIGSAFGASTTMTVDVAGPGVAYKHTLTAFPTITGTGKTASSILLCKVGRLGNHANDTFDDVAYGITVDFHIQYDSMGDPTLP